LRRLIVARPSWPKRLLIANRGGIAIRIARTAADLGIPTVGVFSSDDAASLHVRRVDEAHALEGAGPAAYLDQDRILGAAAAAGCDALHPGYGFLAENAAFAGRCADTGIAFVGPRANVLALFGDKARAPSRRPAASRSCPARRRSRRRTRRGRSWPRSVREAGPSSRPWRAAAAAGCAW
jgi:acetyl/propionyl-CoA carboxylase alpha subunit